MLIEKPKVIDDLVEHMQVSEEDAAQVIEDMGLVLARMLLDGVPIMRGVEGGGFGRLTVRSNGKLVGDYNYWKRWDDQQEELHQLVEQEKAKDKKFQKEVYALKVASLVGAVFLVLLVTTFHVLGWW